MQLLIYLERDSAIHKMRPGVKLITFAAISTLLYSLDFLSTQIIAFIFALICYHMANISIKSTTKQLKPLVFMLIIISLFQLYFSDFLNASIVFIRLLTLILLALLINFTTKISDMVDSIERFISPIERIGVNPKKITLAITLAIRFIPLISEIISQVRMAQKAKGNDKNIFALTIPVIVNTLKMADHVADAINARSFD